MSVLSDLDTPIFAAEGVPEEADPDRWILRVEGMIEQPRELTLAELKALPGARVNARLTSVSGWSVRVDWDGLLWREFVGRYPPRAGASHAVFESIGGYTTSAPLSELDHPRVLLAWGVEGQPLEIDYGGPLRMVIPNLWGYKSCKWLGRIAYADAAPTGYWESRGYTVHGRIEPGTTLDINTRKRRPIKGGEVTEF